MRSETWATIGFGLLLAGCSSEGLAGAGLGSDGGHAGAGATAPLVPEAGPEARARIAGIRERWSELDAGVARAFEWTPRGTVRAPMPAPDLRSTTVRARVELPPSAAGATLVQDEKSGVAVSFVLPAARAESVLEASEGLALYRDAVGPGADLVHRPRVDGTEDFVVFPEKPATEDLRYQVDVTRVAGLRLVTTVLEMLDESGTPRLRMAPPYIVDANGERHAARVEVSGCSYDTSGKAPWDRAVTAPNASSCEVRVDWSDLDAAYPVLVDPAWTTTGDMTIPRAETAAAYIASAPARVILVSFGSGELYGVASKTWAAAAPVNAYYYGQTATPLLNGNVLFTSGRLVSDVYISANDQFIPTQPMSLDREGCTATLLDDGKVLIAGGSLSGAVFYSSAELYDPATNSFTSTAGSMAGPRTSHVAVKLPSGKVFVAGGIPDTINTLDTAEIYDPITEQFTPVASPMTMQRQYIAAKVLTSGKVLILSASGPGRNSAELFDPTDESFTPTGSVHAPIGAFPSLTLLPNGRVLATYDQTSDIYDPQTGTFLPAGDMPNLHYAFANTMATLLPGGVVLVAGGRDEDQMSPYADLFVQAPAGDTCTLTGATGQCESLVCNGGVCCQGACPDPCTTCEPGTGACLLVSGADDPDSCTISQTCSLVGTCLKKDGQMCFSPGECSSGVCADGFCCNTDCSGSCMQCYSNPGTCSAVTNAEDIGSCSGANICDPGGLCKKKTGQTCSAPGQCASGYCKDGYCCSSACDTGCRTCSANPGTCIPVVSQLDVPECSGTQTCSSLGQCKLLTGQGCSAPGDCASGHCVDGVCCGTACSGSPCMACVGALTGAADGTCAPALSGTDPHDDCSDAGASACYSNGQCDGLGGCQQYPVGTVCQAAACTGPSSASQVKTCDATGLCSGGGPLNCLPGVACIGGACPTNCSTGSDCVAPYTCSNGYCKLPLGTACSSAGQCVSGECSDGVCCDVACGGACEACTLAKTGQASGTCAPVSAGLDPDNECADAGPNSCGQNGLCDGVRSCQKYTLGTVCLSASCASGTSENTPDTCDGAGTCIDNGVANCSPGYACVGTTCKSSCALDSDCAAGNICSSGQCLLNNGQACGGNAACATGFCVDGFCCNEACSGACRACSAVKKGSGINGTCGNVVADTDPDDECAPDSGYPASCGADGQCDGTGQCRPTAKDTVGCGATQCASAESVTGQLCTSGACSLSATTTSCSPYVCAGGACTTDCQADTDCASGAYCTPSNTCALKQPNGQNCSAVNECTSGHCVDTVCCDAACAGQCEACAEPNTTGTCTTVSGAPRTGHTPCGGSGLCAGTCNGSDAAACIYDSATPCTPASCTDGTQTTASVCDGAGACSEAVVTSCNAYLCDTTTCKTSCDGATDCAPGHWCTGSQCLPISGADAGAGGSAGAGGAGGGAAGAQGGNGGSGAAEPTAGTGPGGSSGAAGSASAMAGAGAAAAGAPGFEEPLGNDSGGCGCRTRGGSHGSAGVMLAALAAILTAARRRQRLSLTSD